MTYLKEDSLDYHKSDPPGKLEVRPTKPCLTQVDLSLAYSPGVAYPCEEIEEHPDKSYSYTNRGNLVGVISNGSALLGLGNTGALASKPVMEGKGVLFKRFAGVDVFDLELDTHDPEEFIRVVEMLEPTFGGINLEDIAAPECFEIERTLKERMNIPVFHDDQHGTAIITGAALINGLEIAGKELDEVNVVIAGAGSAGIACAEFFESLGVPSEQIVMTDSTGVIHTGRSDINPYKQQHAVETNDRTLADAMEGADVFFGMAVGGIVSPEMIESMREDPIVFACANPDPEIEPEKAHAVRDDLIMGTGRSDYPNQVNNVLGFPFIFRGALDVRATKINEEMKVAAAEALADLAKQDVPENVLDAYDQQRLSFGPDYLIPKPLDERVLLWEATAVAKAAMESGVARREMEDMEEYTHSLERFLGRSREVMRFVMNKARNRDRKILFPEAEEEPILRSCRTILNNEVAEPVLIGDEERIFEKVNELELDLSTNEIEVWDPGELRDQYEFPRKFYELRKRKGITPRHAKRLTKDPHYLGLMSVREGLADGLIAGINRSYPETIRPALQIIGLQEGVSRVAGMYMLILEERLLFYADATVNIEPTAEQLSEIALMAGDLVDHFFDLDPKIAMLSFSNFGSVQDEIPEKVARATQIVREKEPSLTIDGEMQADTALVPEISKKSFPHSEIQGDANVLIFPDLQSGNIAYKLTQHLADADLVGPILMGMKNPVNVLNHYATVNEIVNISAITAVSADRSLERKPNQSD